MKLITGYNATTNTIDEAWENLMQVLTRGVSEDEEKATSRDGNVVGEILNAVVTINDPTRCILTNPYRKLPMRYLIGEMLWYQSGNPGLKAIQNYTKAWDRMSDDGVSVNSNYGNIIQNCIDFYGDTCEFNQYEYVKDLLKADPNSRQAIIHIKTPRDTRIHPTKDLNCTICLQFFLRDVPDGKYESKKLFMTTYMRSNDAWMGFPNDVFQFTAIQIRLAMELNVGIGSYTHIAGSLHLYERDFETYRNHVNAEKTVASTPRADEEKPKPKEQAKKRITPQTPYTYGEMDGLI